MGVSTLYILDPLQRVRRILLGTASQLVHKERDFELIAEIPMGAKAMPGEYLGLMCVDGRFRLFGITQAEHNDRTGTTEIQAIDAAVADLINIVVEDKLQEGVTARAAAESLLQGTGWSLGNVTSSAKTGDVNAYYTSLWEALLTLQDQYSVRIIPYYTIDKGAVTGRHVDVIDNTPTYRGRLIEPETDASDLYITYTGEPVTVLYGLGDETGTESGARLTIAEAVWSKNAGNPADKPKGQRWVEDAAAVAKYGRRERVFIADGVTDANTLMQMTWDELQHVKEPSVNATATIMDLEMAEGMSHKQVRMNDEVVVRPKHHGDVRASIINIERDYVRPKQTKIEVGSELESMTSQVAALTRATIRTKETLTIYQNKFQHDEHLIQLNAEAIQFNAESVLAQAETIRLHGTKLDENEQRIVTAEIAIDGLNSEILLKADKITLQGYVTIDEFEARVAEIERLMSGLATISTLLVNNLQCTGSAAFGGTLNVGGVTVAMQEQEVITSVGGRGVTGEYKTIQYLNWDGAKASTSVCTGITQASFVNERKTLRFVGAPVV